MSATFEGTTITTAGTLTVLGDGGLTLTGAAQANSATHAAQMSVVNGYQFSVTQITEVNPGADLVKHGHIAINESIEAGTSTAQSKLAGFALDESALVSTWSSIGTAEFKQMAVSVLGRAAETVSFDKVAILSADVAVAAAESLTLALEELEVAVSALSDTAATLIKLVGVSVQEAAEIRLSALIDSTYDAPALVLPSTNITTSQIIAGANNTNDLSDEASEEDQSVNIELYQGAWHQLRFPISANGEAIPAINDAKLSLFRGSQIALELTLNNELFFADSEIIAVFDETNTVGLTMGYQFELWIVDPQNNPLYVNGGKITFHPTKVRF